MEKAGKYFKSLRKKLKGTVRFFSSKNKFERESWIVKKFLNLPNSEGFRKPEHDPPDVLYQDARFEVIEILDEGRRRNDEHKERAKLIDEARKKKDITPFIERRQISRISKNEIIDEILRKISNKERRYAPAVTANLDLLVYVNYLNKKLDTTSQITIEYEDSFKKWRSVSLLVNINGGFVIYTNPLAPELLKAIPKF